jgi:hypothetical protein
MAKTTIELADDLVKKAKAVAARRGVTLRALIEQGLRDVIRGDRHTKSFSLRNASVRGRGLQDEFKNREWSDIREAAYKGRGA